MNNDVNNIMVDDVRKLRIHIDGLSELVIMLRPVNQCGDESCNDCRVNSRQIIKAYESLLLAKSWLGKMLQSIGCASPYANNGKRNSVEDIEETADRAENSKSEMPERFSEKAVKYPEMNHIQRVDWLREEINEVIKSYNEQSTIVTTAVNSIAFLQHITEARTWLGFELQRVKQYEEAKKNFAAMSVINNIKTKNEA